MAVSMLPDALIDFIKYAQPTSYADIATLGLVALGTAGALSRGKLWDRDPYKHIWYERPQDQDGGSRAASKHTRNIQQKLEESVSLSPASTLISDPILLLANKPLQNKQAVIFWGSQSGTAEGFANRLARECHLRFGLEALSADLSDYDAETIALIPESKFAIFILSTFGEGDPSDNTAAFWEWIQKTQDQSMSNLRYMAFGLGNRNYKYYNRVLDVVVEALDKFGAHSLMPAGRADDAEGATEEDFISWKDNVFAVFRNQLGLEERDIAYEPTLAVVEDDSLDIIDLHHGEPVAPRDNAKAATATSPIKALRVKHSKELFTSDARNCLHMELDLSDQPELNYKTGDHLAVWPENPDVEVDRMLRVLGLAERAEVPISIKSLDSAVKVRVPTPTTASALFRYYLEICSPVSRDTVTSLAQFAPTPAAKQYLVALGKDKERYHEFQSRNVVTLARLLELSTADGSSWSNLPIPFILETLAPTQPRYYSISSSSVVSPRTPSITAVVSTSELINESSHRIFGLTTNYLLAISQALNSPANAPNPHPHGLTYALDGPSGALSGHKIHAHIRKSKFKLPLLGSHPLIMVAAGTGIAPFRGFLTERARLKTMGKPVGRMILFYGCRRRDEDYLYASELAELQRTLGGEDALTIVTAFSRESNEKVYVQDRVRQRSADVAKLMAEQNANFYICGSASMAREVAKAVTSVLQSEQGWDEGACKQWTDKQKKSNKWQEDVWG